MRNKIIIILATVVLAASPMFAAFDVFLQIDGIPGEAQGTHQGWIQVESFSWGMPQGSSAADSITHVGSGQAAGRAEVHDLTITKKYDKASAAIFQAAMTGRHFKTAVLDINGQRTMLQEVAITAVQQLGASASGGVREVVHLSFARDATHQSASNTAVWNKVNVKVMANATITGDGAPSPITLRSVRQAGQNSAIIVVCDAAGGMGMAGLQRAFMTKQRIPALTISARGAENPQKILPQTQFTFSGVTITGNAPMADGCAQMSLNFTRYAGPPMFVAQ